MYCTCMFQSVLCSVLERLAHFEKMPLELFSYLAHSGKGSEKSYLKLSMLNGLAYGQAENLLTTIASELVVGRMRWGEEEQSVEVERGRKGGSGMERESYQGNSLASLSFLFPSSLPYFGSAPTKWLVHWRILT